MYAGDGQEVAGLGTLKPLTFAQLAYLQDAIGEFVAGFALAGISGSDRATASAAIAVHVTGMSLVDQVKTICGSTFLMAKAAGMMTGNKDWVKGPMLAAQHLRAEHIEPIQAMLLRSFGITKADDDGEPDQNPQQAASSNESPASSPPSTDGQANTSAA